ncbi:MAG: hypothetical protein AAFP98_11555 [Pseudomonadota bacterium]
MSHPYSLCVYAPVQSDLFAINLRKPLKSAWSFEDWDDFGINFSDADLAKSDEITPHTGAVYLRNLRAAGRQTRGWHFLEDEKTRYLTMVLPYWTNDWTRLLLGLNILRQVLPTSGDGQPGYILAHRFDGRDSKTLGAILMRHGTSKVFGPHEDVTQQTVEHAKPLAVRVKAMSKMPESHIIDNMGTIEESHEPA